MVSMLKFAENIAVLTEKKEHLHENLKKKNETNFELIRKSLYKRKTDMIIVKRQTHK